MVNPPATPPESGRRAYSAPEGYVDHGPRVGSLTIVFRDDVSADAARHLIDEIASEAISYDSVDAVKCDVAEFDQGEIDAFWSAALESGQQ